jgi:hypothetical protein
MVLLALITAIYASIGVELFADKEHEMFGKLSSAIFSMFQGTCRAMEHGYMFQGTWGAMGP